MSYRFVLLALLLAACGKHEADQGRTLRADIVEGGDNTEAARTVTAATQLGLTTFDGTGQVVPGLASSWRIADNGLSAIFRLRPQKWPDGKPVSASDVVASFRRAAQASRNPLRLLLQGVDGSATLGSGARPAVIAIDAPVDNIVEIRLSGSMPSLLALLAEPELAVTRAGLRPPPLGPFQIGDTPKSAIQLTRNTAAHTAPAVTLAGLVLTPTNDPGVAIARFARDRTDLVISHGLAGFGDARLLAASNALRVAPSWGV